MGLFNNLKTYIQCEIEAVQRCVCSGGTALVLRGTGRPPWAHARCKQARASHCGVHVDVNKHFFSVAHLGAVWECLIVTRVCTSLRLEVKLHLAMAFSALIRSDAEL